MHVCVCARLQTPMYASVILPKRKEKKERKNSHAVGKEKTSLTSSLQYIGNISPISINTLPQHAFLSMIMFC